MSEIVIHGTPGSPYLRSALLGLEEKGAAYRLNAIQFGEHKQPAHLARHPFGRVPVLDHGDFRLYETQAILRYLDAVFPAPPLRPRDAHNAARMDQIVGIVDSYVFPQVSGKITWQRLVVPMFGGTADEAIVSAALPDARICIGELARLKGAAPFMAGDAITIADLMLAPHIAYLSRTPEGQQLLPGSGLDEWLARMESRPSMRATAPEKLRAAA